MKLHLPLRLLSSLFLAMGMASASAFAEGTYTPTADLGNVMYVGDSITHGISSGSWRWAMHKILTDIGVEYNAVGIMTGNSSSYPSGLSAGTTYGNSTFNHLHCSEASTRAWEISGRKDGSRLGDSNIMNWLGQSSVKNDGTTAYTGATYTGENAPDTFFLLIGTNDLLSDYTNTLHNNLETATADLLGDMSTIHASMRQSNENAQVVVLSIPCWVQHTNNNAAVIHEAVATYNESLKEWAESKASEGVTLIDVNKGMIDVASETSFYGVSSMFRAPGSDGLHPNAQGDLIMAGNVAQQLGYAGRTAGQARCAAADFALQTSTLLQGAVSSSGTLTLGEDGGSLTMDAESTFYYDWGTDVDLSSGFTVDLSLTNGLGNGAVDGWSLDGCLSVALGNGSFSGTLNINEAYIMWGENILYSMDTSTLTNAADHTLRISYVNGNELKSLDPGYYVWMGDMLIGEALAGIESDSALNGLSVMNGTGASLTLDHLSMDAQSWAPTTTRYVNPDNSNPLIKALGEGVATGPGTQAWPEDEATTVTLQNSSYQNKTNAAHVGSTASSGAVYLVVDGGSTISDRYITAGNSGSYTGDVYVTMTGEHTRNATNGYNSAHDTGTLTGSISMRYDSNFKSESSWVAHFTASNGTVTKNAYLEFSSEYVTLNGGKYGGVSLSVGGSYKANINGNVDIVLNSGQYGSHVYGGEVGANGYTIGGNVNVYVNDVIVGGAVYGGGYYGAISGSTAVHISGDATVNGALISAGGAGGTIAQDATLYISDVAKDSDFARFKGTLCGGANVSESGTRTLSLSNVTALNATQLQNFDSIVMSGGSQLSFESLGGATSLSVDSSELVLINAAGEAGTSYEMVSVANAGGIITVSEGVSLSMSYAGDQQTGGTYRLDGGALDFHNSNTSSDVQVSSGSLANTSAAENQQGLTGGIAINATGNVMLSGVDSSQITELNTLSACQVSGLSGYLSLAEAKLALSVDLNSVAGAALVIDSGSITITDSLTLNLDEELSDMLAAQLPGQQAAPLSITMTGEVDAVDQYLILSTGKLEVEASQVNMVLAEGYEDYTVTATGVYYDAQEDYTYVTYAVSSTSQNVPEPASATLSLLAVAALAARRRRRV